MYAIQSSFTINFLTNGHYILGATLLTLMVMTSWDSVNSELRASLVFKTSRYPESYSEAKTNNEMRWMGMFSSSSP